MVYFIAASRGMDPSIILLVLVIVGIICGASFIWRRYTKNKKATFTTIVQNLYPKLTYKPEGFIDKKEYSHMQLLQYGDEFITSDGIQGEIIPGINILYTEIDTCIRQGRYHQTLFNGGIIKFTLSKKTNNRIIISSNALRTTNNVHKKVIKSIGNSDKQTIQDLKIETEDINFNNTFSLYCTSQEDALYILTPQLMQGLVVLNNQYKNGIHVSIVDNTMYIAIINLNLFDASVVDTAIGSATTDPEHLIRSGIKELENITKKIFNK